ncbi:osmoprotectant transport system permease protein [Marinitoga hydrogenitolerans DSM 16785]|uniref:Osmoprotectant transport system permease protein n=1 Tax=Marinitoga hydrogenitolerans (strain DSM 16785 / JCM 12826 / AT1271) TaxID=1122195 RepID=A0A1M4UCZ3_MARH1|nr:ABC transporter permease [Marinitoga hydrogenitolerans]SHE54488.1 osmoprotectant transport system permease protein [Marinitoga hydrogenitolerans DSM 16785]
MSYLTYLSYNYEKIIKELINHIRIIGIALPFAVIIGIGIGFIVSRNQKMSKIVLYIAGILMTIPSPALFGIMVILLAPFHMGLGRPPAIIALVIYSLLPMIRNTLVAIHTLDKGIIESARGMGMNERQILFKIKLPLSIPIIMSGIRNSVVMGVGVATIGYYIAAGGLGYFIFVGLSRGRYEMIITGVILLAVLGVGLNYIMLKFEELITPKGLKVKLN